MELIFGAITIRHELGIIYACFDFFFQKLFLTKHFSLIAAIDLTARGQLYTCLELFIFAFLERTNIFCNRKKRVLCCYSSKPPGALSYLPAVMSIELFLYLSFYEVMNLLFKRFL